MLVNGVAMSGQAVLVTVAEDIEPTQFREGLGLMSDGSLAIDSGTPAGSIYRTGFRVSALGAVYGTTSTDDIVGYMQGIAVNESGQLVYVADSSPDVFANGNPLTHAGLLCVELVE